VTFLIIAPYKYSLLTYLLTYKNISCCMLFYCIGPRSAIKLLHNSCIVTGIDPCLLRTKAVHTSANTSANTTNVYCSDADHFIRTSTCFNSRSSEFSVHH